MKNIIAILFVLALVLFGASQLFSGKSSSTKIGSFFQPGFLEENNIDVGQKPVSVGSTTTNGEGATTKTEGEEKKAVEAPLGYAESQLSPFYKQIRISGVVPPNDSGYGSQFSVSTENLKKAADITGWVVRANLGGSVEIPRAISEFSPYGYNVEGDIILKPNEHLNIYSWKSAIGKNLRLNKCTGFLNQIYTFSPSLPNDCPSIAQDKRIITFTGGCQDFLRSLSSCRTPSANDLNRYTGVNDVECRKVAEQYTFGNCYDINRTKSDFLSNEWRVWTNGAMPFDSKHDRLILFDKQGLVVDEYVY